MNILLGVVAFGILWTAWLSGQSSGPEGPVGAWIVPVPFLLILLGVLGVSIARGRFAWLPGSKPAAAAQQEYAREQADREAHSERALREFRELPADAPLLQFLNMTFLENETVQREVRERIAYWPDRDQEIARILGDERIEYPQLAVTLSYIAWVHPGPPASLAPAFGGAMDRSFPYADAIVRNPYAPSKSEPEISTVIAGAERIAKAGGDLRRQMADWGELIKRTRSSEKNAPRRVSARQTGVSAPRQRSGFSGT